MVHTELYCYVKYDLWFYYSLPLNFDFDHVNKLKSNGIQ